ncbi:MAG TPA: lyase [Burkholderiales bacterium]|nr:lyase [Burkholderiales bacterium]
MRRWLLAACCALAAGGAAADVRVQEYPLPPGLGAHDVWADPAPGAPVWFSAQASGQLGRLDPASGKVELIDLGPRSAPHGVIVGPDGAVWLTDSGQNAIVRVEANTKGVTRFALPGTDNANLNTAAFDRAGILWFTGQSGVYGRLDPASGALKLFAAPRGVGPYGIQVAPDGAVYYASLAGSYLGRVDPASGEARVLEPPTPRQGARRVWPDARGALWVSEWNSGRLARYDPATGAWREWAAPGARPQLYAVYVDETGRVWASEWSAQAMLRFDPATQTFESFKSSSRHPNVRQIHGRNGEVWAAESGADKIVVYRFR